MTRWDPRQAAADVTVLGSGQVTVVWIQTLGDIGAIWRLRWGTEILVKSDQMQRSQSNALKRGIGRGLFSQCLG